MDVRRVPCYGRPYAGSMLPRLEYIGEVGRRSALDQPLRYFQSGERLADEDKLSVAELMEQLDRENTEGRKRWWPEAAGR